MRNGAHPLHVAVADLFEESISSDCQLIRDEACGGYQQIPLFMCKQKSRETEYCDVDLLVLKDGKIRIIVEIEESNVRPTQVCGKYLTAALAQYYIHETRNNKPLRMHNSVTFIQIMGSSNLKVNKTDKFIQWENLERSIQNILPIKGSKITNYRLFYGNKSNFENAEKRSALVACIKEACE